MLETELEAVHIALQGEMHVVYDPNADHPRILDISDANISDAQIGCMIAIVDDAEVSLASKGDSKLPIR